MPCPRIHLSRAYVGAAALSASSSHITFAPATAVGCLTVVRRRDLDDVGADEADPPERAEVRDGLVRAEARDLRRSRPGRERRVQAVDVEREEDGRSAAQLRTRAPKGSGRTRLSGHCRAGRPEGRLPSHGRQDVAGLLQTAGKGRMSGLTDVVFWSSATWPLGLAPAVERLQKLC
jgi:hypothetical protein